MRLPILLVAVTLLICWRATPVRAAEVFDTDVCIFGATSGGVTAAVQASRMGKTAIIAEPSTHLGGMTTGGLGATDTGNTGAIQGMAREFYTRLGVHYGGTSARFTFEPKVAKATLQTMLGEAGVAVRYNQRLASLKKSGSRIVEITMDDGTIYRARMFVDATYEGDLMARAGVSYTVGRESVATYGESLNGIRANTPSHQFALNVDPYVTPGDPTSGLLPFIQPGDGGTPGGGDSRVQAYNFRMCLTQVASRLPIQPPLNYAASPYELLGRYVQARVAAGHSLNLRSFMNIASMPNGKTDVNNNGAFSTDFIGANYDYPEATFAQRVEIVKAHENYIRGFFTYLATSPNIPASIRAEMLSWGLPADEFLETGGWPPQIYVREARRMISDYVMTQADCQGARSAADPIGLASYTMDSHNCQRIVQNGFVRNEGDVQSPTPSPFSISYRSIIPKQSECENLLVPFCLSASHIAFGSIRMEPVLMILGQVAGTAACFAIDGDLPVQQVNYEKLKQQSLADRQALTWGNPASGPAVIVDNTDASGVTITGEWLPSTSVAGYIGSDYIHNNNVAQGTKSVRYTPTLPATGTYEVALRWTANPNRATNIPVDIVHAGGTSTYTINQQSQGSTWVPIATLALSAGSGSNVTIRTTSTNGFVVADAVRFTDVTLPVTTAVQLIASDPVARERALKPGRFTVVRDGNTAQPLTINLQISGSASPGTDYNAIPSSVIIPAGQLSQIITVAPVADSLAEGNEHVIATIAPSASYTAGALASATVTIKDIPLDEWKAQTFTGGQLADPAVSGTDRDPNGNGLINFLEYALGRDPLANGPGALPSPGFDPLQPVERRLQLTYQRPYPKPADVDYIIEVAGDLTEWNDGADALEEITSTPSGRWQEVTVREREAATTPLRFMRLRVEPK
jgi:hypothetical protein